MPTQDVSPSPLTFAVTPHNSTNFAQEVRQLYVGSSGTVSVVNVDNSVVQFVGLNAGSMIGPFYIKRVNSTGTTCTGIVAFV